MAVACVTRRHRGCRIAMHIGNHDLVTFFKLRDDKAEPRDNLRDDFVRLPADIEVEIRLDAELLQHAAGEVLVEVLSCMTEYHKVPAIFQFPIQRNLLDDIGLGRDQNQMHMRAIRCLDLIVKAFGAVGDLLHGIRLQQY